MQWFFNRMIKSYIIENRYKSICEIGAGDGSNTDRFLLIDSVILSVIDPCFDTDLCAKYKGNKRVKVLKGMSLEIIPNISEKFDCILIDGDHNWYTVFNELKIIKERNLIKEGGTIFLHDVCWPYGRRDMYYIPESIPEEFRHPYTRKGIEYGKSELSENSRINEQVNNAIYEAGPKNGVLTAVEDFLNEFRNEYLFYFLKVEYGLGFIIRKKDIKTRVVLLKWFFLFWYYEIYLRTVLILKRSFPNLYLYLSRIKRRINIKIRT